MNFKEILSSMTRFLILPPILNQHHYEIGGKSYPVNFYRFDGKTVQPSNVNWMRVGGIGKYTVETF